MSIAHLRDSQSAFGTGLTQDRSGILPGRELTRTRRFDPIFNVVQRVIDSLLSFRPAIRYRSRKVRLDRRKRGDASVFAAGGMGGTHRPAELRGPANRLPGGTRHEQVYLCRVSAALLFAGCLPVPLASADLSPADVEEAKLQLRLVAAEDESGEFTRVPWHDHRLPPQTPLPLHSETLFDETDVESVVVRAEPARDGFHLILELTEEARERFADVTGDNIGRRLAIVFNGRIYSGPAVRERIAHGRVQISGSFNREEAERLALAIAAGDRSRISAGESRGEAKDGTEIDHAESPLTPASDTVHPSVAETSGGEAAIAAPLYPLPERTVPEAGRFGWRIEAHAPVRISSGWFSVIAGKVTGHSGGGTEGTARTGPIEMGLETSEEDGFLVMRMWRTRSLGAEETLTASLESKTAIPPGASLESVWFSSDGILGSTGYTALWEGRFIRGGELVMRVVYAAAALAPDDPLDSFSPQLPGATDGARAVGHEGAMPLRYLGDGEKSFLGLDLSGAPHTIDWSELPDLFEERPSGSKSYELRDDVVAARHPDKWMLGEVLYVPRMNRFYVQRDPVASSSLTYYGPFEGKPWGRLGIPEPEGNPANEQHPPTIDAGGSTGTEPGAQR